MKIKPRHLKRTAFFTTPQEKSCCFAEKNDFGNENYPIRKTDGRCCPFKVRGKPRLIIGLGNPDKKYEKTYHNVGFLAVDFFAKNSPISKLLKSDVYMNQSGNFVKAALKKYKANPEELLVVHDDADLLLGKYKLSINQGSAGHKGIESIIKALDTKNFYRLRIGIRNPKSKAKALNLVLKKIKNPELLILNQVFEEITENNLPSS